MNDATPTGTPEASDPRSADPRVTDPRVTDPRDADPRAQAQYQVRFAYGARGERELAGVDVLVIADELDPAADAVGIAGAAAVVERVLAAQADRGDRVSVGVVARGSDAVSFAVEDVLAAGAVIDALAAAGIDHCSPEAAAMGAAYSGLTNATRHLVSASVAARLARQA